MEEAVEAKIFHFHDFHVSIKTRRIAEAIFIMQVGRVYREKIQKALQIARCSFFLGQWQLKFLFKWTQPKVPWGNGLQL